MREQNEWHQKSFAGKTRILWFLCTQGLTQDKKGHQEIVSDLAYHLVELLGQSFHQQSKGSNVNNKVEIWTTSTQM